MDSKGIIRKRLAQHRDIIEQILADEKLQDTIAQITDTIVTCFKYGGRVTSAETVEVPPMHSTWLPSSPASFIWNVTFCRLKHYTVTLLTSRPYPMT